MVREHLTAEVIRLCTEANISVDDTIIQNILRKYSVDELSRFLDACYRFGIRNIMEVSA